MKRFSMLVLAVAIVCFLASGCAKLGEVTGKAVKEVKEMPQEFKDGYEKGRSGETAD